MLHGQAAVRRLAHRQPPLRQSRRSLFTIAIESSCDDTAVAVLERHDSPSPKGSTAPAATLHFNRKITLNTVNSRQQRGIDPIKALDSHRHHLAKLVGESLGYLPETPAHSDNAKGGSLRISNKFKAKPDFISVTRGPGMRSNLSCGLDTAKGLAAAWQIPLLAVHHMQAHTLTPRLCSALDANACGRNGNALQPQFPFLTLLVSGGHTMLLHSRGLTDHATLATTAGDPAAGAALDKIGRLVLPAEQLHDIPDVAFAKHLSLYATGDDDAYSWYAIPRNRGAEIEKPLNEFGWKVQTPLAKTRELAFSFAGFEARFTALFNERERMSKDGSISDAERLVFAREALAVAFEHLASRTVIALESLRGDPHPQPISTLVVSGGVAANRFLRHVLRGVLDARGFAHVGLVFPAVDLCTDNAAMVAWAGMEMYEAGWRSDLGCIPLRRWSVDSRGKDGGITGVDGWANVLRGLE